MRRKDVVAVGICAIMALSGLAACGSTGKANAQDEMGNPEVGGVQIPNPFVDCETLEEAEKLTARKNCVSVRLWAVRISAGTIMCMQKKKQWRQGSLPLP